MISTKQYSYISIILIIIIAFFGYFNRVILKDKIMWSSRLLMWDDFQPIKFIEGDYDALVYSDIKYPKRISEDSFMVYAFMDPNQSERVGDEAKDSLEVNQLLIHERYHFNVTEYCARLFRKELVSIGYSKLTNKRLKYLYNKYIEKLDQLQFDYDEESEHNTDYYQQRYWELEIDNMLRETNFYENPNLFSYSKFTDTQTVYFKNLYHTLEHEILTALPISKEESFYGESYKIIRKDNKITITFIKDGIPTNGGAFETAITTITRNKDNEVILEYYDTENNYNTTLHSCITKAKIENRTISRTYFNAEGEQIKRDNVYNLVYKYNQDDESFYSSYYNKNGDLIKNSDSIYHEKRNLDSDGRTNKITNYNNKNELELDIYLAAIHEYTFSKINKIISYRMYNTKRELAIHLDEFNFEYKYDARGNLKSKTLLDEQDFKKNNISGISVQKFIYNKFDNLISLKRFNNENIAVVGDEDYFQEVYNFDSIGKLTYKAKFYPGNVLRFDDDKWGATQYKHINDSVYFVKNVDVYNDFYNDDRGIAKIKYLLNSKQEIIEEVFYNINDNFALDSYNISYYKYVYDNRGNLISQFALDSTQTSVAFEGEVAIVRWKYDRNNNKTETSYYNVNNKITTDTQGVAYNNFVYNNKNQLIERTNYNSNKKPALLDGVYKTTIKINRFGKDSIVKKHTRNNTLISGISTTHYKYNSYGKLIKESYYNAANSPVKNKNGVTKISYQYDKYQRYLGYTYLNASNWKTNDKKGVCQEKIEYDSNGSILKQSYYDKRKKNVIGDEGYHAIEYIYNEAQIFTRISTYNTNKELMPDATGIADYVYQVLPSSIITRISYYNTEHELIEDLDGIAEYFYSKELNGLYYLDKQLDALGDEVSISED